MVLKNLFCLLLCSFLFHNILMEHCRESSNPFFGAQIILFYAPLHSEDIKGQIVIYHFHPQFLHGDKVILIENNTISGSIMFVTKTPKKGSDVIYTGIAPIYLGNDSDSPFIPHFSGYCAYWERDDIRSKKFCLTTQPQWMHLNRHIIGNRTLRNLLIPGTHQSGSYSQVYPQSLVNKFAATQDQTVLEQLIAGVRYIDLRPAYKNGIYYHSHGFIFMQPLSKILHDIKEFLNNTQEILIVSFIEFYRAFNDTIHENFMNYLETEFRNHYLNTTGPRWSMLLKDIWETNRRLIIIYDHWLAVRRQFIWPYIIRKSGNVAPGQNLKSFVATAESSVRKPKVTLATYTMQGDDIWNGITRRIFGRTSVSLHDLAVSTGPNITQWYNELHYDSASIVAVDYIEATGIVDFCIEWNKRYSSRCVNQYMDKTFSYGYQSKF